jgi:signal transduction histidine kinase
MLRLSLVWRLALIVIGAVVVIQLFGLAGLYLQRERASEFGVQPRLPEQVAALVRLIEGSNAEQRDMALRVVKAVGLAAWIEPRRPDWIATGWHAVRVERWIAAALDGPPRTVAARIGADPDSLIEGSRPLRDLLTRRLVMFVELRDGGYLITEASGELLTRVVGLPAGVLVSSVALLVACLAVLGVARETRPLARLAATVERFGAKVEPVLVPERGEPDVRAVIRAVNTMQSRIAALVRNQSLMIGAISHDLRTYATRLRLRVESIPDAERRARAVGDIEDMQTLMEDALAFARGAFVEAKRERVDLAEIVARECDERAAAGVAVDAALPGRPVVVAGSAVALARAVANLIDNAVKYGERAELTLSASPRAAVLTVDDHGPGIPAEARESVFDPFSRLEASRNRDRGGAGLGLAIVRQVAESHGGTIAIEDAPSGGARFRLTLPLAA